ncbi:uncharacterized protein C8Q71DRAFT_863932 [Rhodofomes roseus]|nr:uncharacterized protein C8Q71DRAFT_863932 [Rhodofomes roseus]KAH9828535.1 hypothetical protein C8Q71DRAFT_863932 [Rhodofomes roseus]
MDPRKLKGFHVEIEAVALCMYCGDVNDGASQMLTCQGCGLFVCSGGPDCCVEETPGAPLNSHDFHCPQCSHYMHRPITYHLRAHAAQWSVYAQGMYPILLYTAHEPRLPYLTTLLGAQFEQDYALCPGKLHSASLTLAQKGWDDLDNIIGAAREWKLRGPKNELSVLAAVECHSDPESGGITYRRNQNGRSFVNTVTTVVELMFGALWRDLPVIKGHRGLVLMSCGYMITNPACEKEICTLVTRGYFTFIIGFPTTTLIPQHAALSVTRFLQKIMVRGIAIEDALQQACFVDADFMATTGLHLTYRTTASTIKQVAYGAATLEAPWGARLNCPNPACKGSPLNVRPRVHKKHEFGTLVKFRCWTCMMETRDYVHRPPWVVAADAKHRIVEYPMVVDGTPVADALVGRYEIVPWTPQDSQREHEAMDTT